MSEFAWTSHMFSPCNLLDQVLSVQFISHLYANPTNWKKSVIFDEDWYTGKCLTVGFLGKNNTGDSIH